MLWVSYGYVMDILWERKVIVGLESVNCQRNGTMIFIYFTTFFLHMSKKSLTFVPDFGILFTFMKKVIFFVSVGGVGKRAER